MILYLLDGDGQLGERILDRGFWSNLVWSAQGPPYCLYIYGQLTFLGGRCDVSLCTT